MTSISFKRLIEAANNRSHPTDEALWDEIDAWSEPFPKDEANAQSVRDALMEITHLPATTRRWLGLATDSPRARHVAPTGDSRISTAVSDALSLPPLPGETRSSRAQNARLDLLIAREQIANEPRSQDIVKYTQRCLDFATQACGLRGEAHNVGKALKKYLKYGGNPESATVVLAEAVTHLCRPDSTVKDVALAVHLWNTAALFIKDKPNRRLRMIQDQLWDAWQENPLQYDEEPLRPLSRETPLLDKHTVSTLQSRYPAMASMPSVPEAVQQFTTQLLKAAEPASPPTKAKKLLLAGPPGGGKSFLAYVVGREAAERRIPMLELHCSDVLDKYHGGTLNNLRAIFKDLREQRRTQQTPVLLFLDEVDQLLGARTTDSREQGGIVTALLHFLDEQPHVFVIAATNCVELLDPAAQQAFDYSVRKELCSSDELSAMMVRAATAATLAPHERRALASLSMGLSPRDLVFAVSHAEERLRSGEATSLARGLARAIVDAQLNRAKQFNIQTIPMSDGVVWNLYVQDFRDRAARIPPGDYFSIMLQVHNTVVELGFKEDASFVRNIRGPNIKLDGWALKHKLLPDGAAKPPLTQILECVDDHGGLRIRLSVKTPVGNLLPSIKTDPVINLARLTDS